MTRQHRIGLAIMVMGQTGFIINALHAPQNNVGMFCGAVGFTCGLLLLVFDL